MIQTRFLVVFLSSDIYERPVLKQLTAFPMTVHAGFILHRFIQNWLLHVLAKDCVSVGCLLLFFCLSERFLALLMIIIWSSAGKVLCVSKVRKVQSFHKTMTNIYAGEA